MSSRKWKTARRIARMVPLDVPVRMPLWRRVVGFIAPEARTNWEARVAERKRNARRKAIKAGSHAVRGLL